MYYSIYGPYPNNFPNVLPNMLYKLILVLDILGDDG